jgi:hypothetical protein
MIATSEQGIKSVGAKSLARRRGATRRRDSKELANCLRRITYSHIYSQSTSGPDAGPAHPPRFRQRSAEDFHFTPPPTCCLLRSASSGTARIRLRILDVRRNVPLPCDAARIPAAHYGLDLSCPCRSTTCNARELACDLHYSQSETSRHVNVGDITPGPQITA